MNFSTIEDSVLEEKKKFNNFLSHILKNSRILIILLTASVITAVSVSIWIKSPEYQVLYNNLSNEDSGAIVNQLNQMKIPYQFSDVSSQISVPKSQLYDIRLRLAEKNLPRGGGVGFELLDKEKFGISQFNEQINYQRALEGELARTIQRINIIKNARIHLVFPKSSLFLQDKKKSSASVVLELQPGQVLETEQINAIIHIISGSVAHLSSKNITIVDQFGQLLNQPSLEYQKFNNLQFKYSENIESRYRNRIKDILEPLVGIGNVHAQVNAQIDFNVEEETREKYSPNSHHNNQAIRSYQNSIHDQVEKQDIPTSLSNDNISSNTNDLKNTNDRIIKNTLNFPKNKKKLNNFEHPTNANINRDKTINYELNHSVSHTTLNTGEIKRLSAAVIVNFIKEKNGKFVPLTKEKMKQIEDLIRETMGYSKTRGDSVHVVNALFVRHQEKISTPVTHSNKLDFSSLLFNMTPWLLSVFFLCILLKKYICPFSKKNISKNKMKNEKEYLEKYNNTEKNTVQENIKDNLNTDTLIHQICNISNQNPRTIALIMRQWMSDKI